MTKSKNRLYKVFAILFVAVFSFSGCSLLEGLGIGGTGSMKVANSIQKSETGLSNFTVGELLLDSTIEYYKSGIETADTWLTESEAYGLTAEEVTAIESWKTISQYIVDNVPDVNESSQDGVNAAYIGNESGSYVSGIFVYEFTNGLTLTADLAEKANIMAEDTLEYYFVKGNYLITVENQFVSGNGLTFDDIAAAADSAIK